MKRKLVIALAAVLMLAGCSPISSGYVTKKTDEQAYSYVTMQCMVFSKYGCSAYVPIEHYVPEKFKFDLKNQDKTGWVYVGKDTFDHVQVGDVYNDEGK